MPSRRNLTPEEKSEIIALRQKGWSLEGLAEKFNCHVGSVSWCCLMNGVSAPGAQRKPIDNSRLEQEYRRNGKPVRRFSPEEDKLIREMRERGESIASTYRATKRRHNSIIGRLCSLARWEELEERCDARPLLLMWPGMASRPSARSCLPVLQFADRPLLRAQATIRPPRPVWFDAHPPRARPV